MAVKEPKAPTSFYYKLMGQVIGPVTGTQLRQAALDSDIDPFTPVRVNGNEDWIPASHLTKLFHRDGTPIRFEEVGASATPRRAHFHASENGSEDFFSLMHEFETHEVPRPAGLLDLKFKNFVTPQLVKFLYLGTIAVSLCCIGLSFYWGFDHAFLLASVNPSMIARIVLGVSSALLAFFLCLTLLIAVRVVLESVMVCFRMCHHLENISRITARGHYIDSL